MAEPEIIDEAPFLRLLSPPWWNLLGRYRMWRLKRALRRLNGATVYYYVPDSKTSAPRSSQ
jgi:hypothetical protein